MQAAMYQASAYHQPQVHHQGAAAAVAYHHQQQQQGSAAGFNPHQAGAMAAMGQHDPAALQQHFHLTFQQQAGDCWSIDYTLISTIFPYYYPAQLIFGKPRFYFGFALTLSFELFVTRVLRCVFIA